jgi:hypothetical protein
MMTERLPARPAPGPLEEYAQAFDALFAKRSQRESLRRCLEGLLLPMERNKTRYGNGECKIIRSAPPDAPNREVEPWAAASERPAG